VREDREANRRVLWAERPGKGMTLQERIREITAESEVED
jgi:hypothetical protein